MIRKSILPLVLFLLVLASPALAHRINVFALDEGGTVYTESTFAGKRPVKKGVVRVLTEQGTQLLSGETDELGIFRFSRPDSGVLVVEVDAGMGHKSQWTLEAVDGAVGIPPDDPVVPVSPNVGPGESGLSPGDWKKMDRMVETAVTMALHRAKAETRLQDIVGGIGYIVGLLGLAAWLQNRRGQA